MLLNNAPTNEAILSNVGEIGEFRIRNSAKAFSILSSGLYANKIRAIVRELSCNAVDSHTAADRAHVPFDVHLPSQLDPTFSIRDYGTGLSHEQVINIYTTYFESTKTNSNAFIGALGLGSKSPFSYTDNFTVTATQNGKRGVYSAFINGEGVPSIALMHSEDTDQPNGVEVKFAVESRDFYKFEDEARTVYTYFKLRPVVNGGFEHFEFNNIEYEDTNIIPGVHVAKGRGRSRAVMGNIAYPIEVPNIETNLGPLGGLLDCGLEMHFDIGELDFQASREGLSYIPQTINAIKAKLEALNKQLSVHLTLEADAILNKWDRVAFLRQKANHRLWGEAVKEYIKNTGFDLVTWFNNYLTDYEFKFKVEEIAQQYNIEINGFTKTRGSSTCRDHSMHRVYVDGTQHTEWTDYHKIPVTDSVVFVENDLKTGALTRAKYHWRNTVPADLPETRANSHSVFLLNPVDRKKPMKLAEFYAELQEPPRRIVASTMKEKERAVTGSKRSSDVRILLMTESRRGYRDEYTWSEAGRADQYDATQTYYYIPLSGYTPVRSGLNAHSLAGRLSNCGSSDLENMKVYGVRKSDIEWVKAQANWVDLEEHLKTFFGNLNTGFMANLALNEVDHNAILRYNNDIAKKIENKNSPYLLFTQRLRGMTKVSYSSRSLDQLLAEYAPGVSLQAMIDAVKAETVQLFDRYPLFGSLHDYRINATPVAEYINLIDNSKGV